MTSLIPCSSCVMLSPRMIETMTERNPHSSIGPVFVCESPDHGKTASFPEFSEFFRSSLGAWDLEFGISRRSGYRRRHTSRTSLLVFTSAQPRHGRQCLRQLRD